MVLRISITIKESLFMKTIMALALLSVVSFSSSLLAEHHENCKVTKDGKETNTVAKDEADCKAQGGTYQAPADHKGMGKEHKK